MTTTDPRLTLLARAEKDGKPVHAGLRKRCQFVLSEADIETYGRHDVPMVEHGGYPHTPDDVARFCSPVCGVIPNPDPMALIASIRAVETYGKKLWTVHFWEDDVSIGLAANYFRWTGKDLLDAAVKATAALEPENWERCNGACRTNVKCSLCYGTNLRIKEPA